MSWLLLLLKYLFPHATEGEVEPPEETDEADDSAGEEEAEVEAEAEGEAEAEAKPDERVESAVRAATEAQREVETLRRQVSARSDPTMDEEERKLRDPTTSDLEKWQIQSNRALRQSQMQSQQALFQAQDMADKTTYQVKAAANPLYSKYESKVEAELSKARANNQYPSRELILAVLIGKDQLAGNFKPVAPKGVAKTIARGKPTGARSDTPTRGSMTEHQKREARLANQQI